MSSHCPSAPETALRRAVPSATALLWPDSLPDALCPVTSASPDTANVLTPALTPGVHLAAHFTSHIPGDRETLHSAPGGQLTPTAPTHEALGEGHIVVGSSFTSRKRSQSRSQLQRTVWDKGKALRPLNSVGDL